MTTLKIKPLSINKGQFKNRNMKKEIICANCGVLFKGYKKEGKDRKYCSNVCYNLDCRGKKRPEHSSFMKNYAQKNKLGVHLVGRVQSKEERKKTSDRMIKRWADPADKLNSEENKQKISDRNHALNKLGLGISTYNKGYARGRQGTYNIDGVDMYFRSLWEVNYALYLNFLIKQKQIKHWEYEVDTFWFEEIRRGVRSYKPDFKVYNNDGTFEYHEVKGYMDKKSNTKLKRMKKYYPKIKMVLIDSVCYKDIKRKIGKACNFYQ